MNYRLIFNKNMKDKNIQELIDLYRSGKLDIVKKKVVQLIEKYPNSFILYNLFGAVLAAKLGNKL